MAEISVCRVIGLKINPMTMEELLLLISNSITRGTKSIIVNQNLHGAYWYYKDEKFRALHERSYVHIDGMPIVWLGCLSGKRLKRAHRFGYIDLIWPLMRAAASQGWKVFYLGSEPNVQQCGLARLRQALPSLTIDGYHGFFDPRPDSPENAYILQRIHAFRPNIVVVGMGMPRQEHWIFDNAERIAANCFLASGACMELIAGTIPLAPRWLGPLGLEWLYRLVRTPQRTWRRYLLEPWLLFGLVIVHKLSRRRSLGSNDRSPAYIAPKQSWERNGNKGDKKEG